jgi:hypothetical protein
MWSRRRASPRSFYRYFERRTSSPHARDARDADSFRGLAEIPAKAVTDGASGRAVLRRWLRRYNLTQANEAAMFRVWVDAALQDATLRANSAPALDWGRRVMASFLERRGFGDVDTEGLVMVALLGSFERGTEPGGRRRRAHHRAGLSASAGVDPSVLPRSGGVLPLRAPKDELQHFAGLSAALWLIRCARKKPLITTAIWRERSAIRHRLIFL